MDIKTKKSKIEYSNDIIDIIQHLQYKDYKINVAGTASYKSQYYYSDYDLNTDISKEKNIKNIIKEFNKILNYTNDNLYFIEFKVQFMNGKKKKYNSLPIKFNKLNRNELEYFKIDYVIFSNYEFVDLSIKYNLSDVEILPEEIIKKIEEDKKEFFDNGDIFKSLKRQFSIYNMEDNKKGMIYLSKLFNSDYGKLYKLTSNLNTILLILKKYGDNKIVKKRVEFNLLKYGLNNNIKSIKEYIKKISNIYNKEALKYYKKLF